MLAVIILSDFKTNLNSPPVMDWKNIHSQNSWNNRASYGEGQQNLRSSSFFDYKQLTTNETNTRIMTHFKLNLKCNIEKYLIIKYFNFKLSYIITNLVNKWANNVN